MQHKIQHFVNHISLTKTQKAWLKRVYILAVICLVAYAFINLYHQVTWDDIKHSFQGIGVGQSSLMIGLGILSVVPMVIYDYVYNQKVAHSLPWPSLLKNSYIINTFTNIGGGGGMIGANLRVFLFGKADSKVGTTAMTVVQIALFTLFGLATNDLLAIVMNWGFLLSLSWKIKLLCFLFPIIYPFVPYLSANKILKHHDRLLLMVGSSLEWLAALGLFLSIGYIMGFHFNLIRAYLIVCFAGIAGAVSLIPGGLGSFDATLIFGMSSIGISANQAVAWAVMYRICYYVIPAVIGAALLAITLIHKYFKKGQLL